MGQMKAAETVTFGGSGLDRAAGFRADTAGIAALWREARVLPVWQGRPLMAEAGLGWLAADHAVIARGPEAALFLGRDEDGRGLFALDISDWQPQAPTEAVPGFFDASRQPHPDLPAPWAFQELRAVMVDLSPREAELAATARALGEWHKRHGFCAACGAGSVSSHAGWQRHCPACGAAHFPRTDPVVIMLVLRGNKLLLGRGKGWPEKMYSCLAGFVEPGETIEAAVRREVFEESGVICGRVEYLASQPWPWPASLMLGCRTEALSDEIALDPAELEDARWVTREEMVTAFAGEHPEIRALRKGAIAQFLIANWLADSLD
jgi:NAD+ diphosphatase